ncbi:MAG TPA: alkaline phosphatase family protein [Rhodopila sp.]|jgi:phospholipase C
MDRYKVFTRCCIAVAVAGPVPVEPAWAQSDDAMTLAPPSSDVVRQYISDLTNEPKLSHADKLRLLKQNIKYVFVLFQENRSFDFHLGTFPGADGLFSKSADQTAGFSQPIVNTDGSAATISPFLIPQTVTDVNGKTVPLYPADTDSVDHSHAGIDNSLDVDASGVAANDRYALNEEGLTTKNGQIVSLSTGAPATAYPTLTQKQRGELVMSHIDCDTIPFVWQYADRFTLFDNFHQTIIGPSTPNAIAMIAGQSGETQWALHPEQGSNNTASSTVSLSGGQPIVADPGPFPGSNLDQSPTKPPYNAADENPATPALNQTYASLPLSFMGNQIGQTIQSDENPALDLADVQHDIQTIASGLNPINWGWYQEGYDAEPTDTSGTASHTSYIVHHNGPQYFGYVGDNTVAVSHLHGLNDFFNAVAAQQLPASGGVFYVRGGYDNIAGLNPLDPNPAVQKNFPGDDDHPGYSDAQISEALLAREINAIASSPYWKNSAIIITYDETDGLYDHALPRIRSFDPEGSPLAGGPRIPAIVISPFSHVHVISHAYSEHSSVIKFIDELFDLTPLADLPDEVRGRKLGLQEFGQKDLGPADDRVPDISSLFSAFDNGRLTGATAPLPAAYAEIDDSVVKSLPHYGGQGCYTLNIVPTDYVGGKLIDPPPADFNPRPGTTPGTPTSGSWTP